MAGMKINEGVLLGSALDLQLWTYLEIRGIYDVPQNEYYLGTDQSTFKTGNDGQEVQEAKQRRQAGQGYHAHGIGIFKLLRSHGWRQYWRHPYQKQCKATLHRVLGSAQGGQGNIVSWLFADVLLEMREEVL